MRQKAARGGSSGYPKHSSISKCSTHSSRLHAHCAAHLLNPPTYMWPEWQEMAQAAVSRRPQSLRRCPAGLVRKVHQVGEEVLRSGWGGGGGGERLLFIEFSGSWMKLFPAFEFGRWNFEH
ncbi:MAG: hypothetical protein ACKERG_00635 [Candidatus Hodgkinia cicadicola]